MPIKIRKIRFTKMMSYRFMLQTTQWEKKSFFAAQYNNGATVVANPLMGNVAYQQLDHLLSPLTFIQTEPVLPSLFHKAPVVC